MSIANSADKMQSDVAPILRTLFSGLTDDELETAQARLREFFRFLYLRYRDEIEDAIASHSLDN